MPKEKPPLIVRIKPGPRALTAEDAVFIFFGMTMQQFTEAVILNKDGRFDGLYKTQETSEAGA